MLLMLMPLLTILLTLGACFLVMRLLGRVVQLWVQVFIVAAGLLISSQAFFLSVYMPVEYTWLAVALMVLQSLGALLVITSLWPHRTLLERQRQSANAYDQMLKSIVDIYYVTGADGNFEVMSDSAYQVLGYRPEELIGQPAASFYDKPESRERLMTLLDAGGGTVDRVRILYRHKEGRLLVMEVSARYRRDQNGRVVGIEGISRDITSSLQADELSNELGRIVESGVTELFVFDAKTLKFTLVNRGARENLGYSMAELSQLTAVDLKPELSLKQFHQLISPLLSGAQQSVSFQTVHRRKDGSTYPVEVVLQYVAAELEPKFFAHIQDITRRLQVESELVQSQRLQSVGQLTGGVAHDFNNMLQALQLYIEQINPVAEEELGFRDSALHVITRASQLTQRLLAFSRRQVLSPRVIDVNQTLLRLDDLLRRTLGENLTLTLALSEVPGFIEIDEAQLESGLMNLVINARDAMPDGGELVLQTRLVDASALPEQRDDLQEQADIDDPDARYIQILVSDTGEGMPPSVLLNALEPFFTTKDVGEGTGLGLSMVYGFVSQSGGLMQISSEPGAGTRVSLFFPVKDTVPDEKTAPDIKVAAETLSKGRVLLIEDEDVVREITARTLRALGYQVTALIDGPAALALLDDPQEQKNPAITLILSDVMLPGGLSGPALCQQITAELGPIPTLYMSGHSMLAANDQDVPVIKPLLQKPFTREQLATAVGSALAGGKPAQANHA